MDQHSHGIDDQCSIYPFSVLKMLRLRSGLPPNDKGAKLHRVKRVKPRCFGGETDASGELVLQTTRRMI